MYSRVCDNPGAPGGVTFERIDKQEGGAGGGHPEGEWQAEASWDSCDQGQGGANGHAFENWEPGTTDRASAVRIRRS